tara:strand:- start:915 stop:1304 length:390 start_codon:yes stop_codon:yes gene_type:complete
MSIWDDKKWRRMQFDLQEAEQQQQQGDEKLTQMVTSMTDYVMSMQTTLGTLPNYLPILMKPNDPAKSPEQNNIDRDTIIAAMKSLDDNQKLLTQTYSYFNKYIKQKYKFNPGSMESKPGERINKVNKGE